MVERVGVVEVLRPQTKQASTPEAAPPPVAETAPTPEPARRDGEVMLTVFKALGYALSARGLLFLSLIGAFALACMAMVDPTAIKIAVLIVYAAATVIPVTTLEIRKRALG